MARSLQNIDPERERLYELCERTGVGIDVMKVYGGGDLLSEENSPFGRAMTPVQAIEYALSRPGVASVMIGCKSKERFRRLSTGAVLLPSSGITRRYWQDWRNSRGQGTACIADIVLPVRRE